MVKEKIFTPISSSGTRTRPLIGSSAQHQVGHDDLYVGSEITTLSGLSQSGRVLLRFISGICGRYPIKTPYTCRPLSIGLVSDLSGTLGYKIYLRVIVPL